MLGQMCIPRSYSAPRPGNESAKAKEPLQTPEHRRPLKYFPSPRSTESTPPSPPPPPPPPPTSKLARVIAPVKQLFRDPIRKMGARQKLRILCFGDSLTAGYHSWGSAYHEYSEMMVQLLEMAFPDMEVDTVVDGKPGDTVKFGFLPRMQEDFSNKAEAKYDWAIVLGGTNDLARNVSDTEIFHALKAVWDVPLRKNTKVLALTVPEPGVKISVAATKKRLALNNAIKSYKRTNFHVFDLAAAISYFTMTSEEQERYWDDAIHFTPDGYDFIGNKIGTFLVSILAKEKAENDPSPAKRRRYFKDDEKVFDEEDENPPSIDKGYIVVRRRDLD